MSYSRSTQPELSKVQGPRPKIRADTSRHRTALIFSWHRSELVHSPSHSRTVCCLSLIFPHHYPQASRRTGMLSSERDKKESPLPRHLPLIPFLTGHPPLKTDLDISRPIFRPCCTPGESNPTPYRAFWTYEAYAPWRAIESSSRAAFMIHHHHLPRADRSSLRPHQGQTGATGSFSASCTRSSPSPTPHHALTRSFSYDGRYQTFDLCFTSAHGHCIVHSRDICTTCGSLGVKLFTGAHAPCRSCSRTF